MITYKTSVQIFTVETVGNGAVHAGRVILDEHVEGGVTELAGSITPIVICSAIIVATLVDVDGTNFIHLEEVLSVA